MEVADLVARAQGRWVYHTRVVAHDEARVRVVVDRLRALCRRKKLLTGCHMNV